MCPIYLLVKDLYRKIASWLTVNSILIEVYEENVSFVPCCPCNESQYDPLFWSQMAFIIWTKTADTIPYNMIFWERHTGLEQKKGE